MKKKQGEFVTGSLTAFFFSRVISSRPVIADELVVTLLRSTTGFSSLLLLFNHDDDRFGIGKKEKRDGNEQLTRRVTQPRDR